MKKLLVALLCLFSAEAFAADDALHLNLTPSGDLQKGKPVDVTAKLTHADGKPVTTEELQTMHTQKFHLLVADPTLTDYQHIHPSPTTEPGSYSFSFTPKFDTGYRAWADVTPVNGKQQYVMADLGKPVKIGVKKSVSSRADVAGYHFTLNFDHAPAAGKASMGTLTVSKSGVPVQTLQPVMGAFAHIVGFYDDYSTVVHAHPLGDEPKDASVRGGPKLTFHFEPAKPGFVKLFAQVRINNQDVFVPFGVKVAK